MSPCLLGQHGNFSTAQWPVECGTLRKHLQNLFNNLPPHTVLYMVVAQHRTAERELFFVLLEEHIIDKGIAYHKYHKE